MLCFDIHERQVNIIKHRSELATQHHLVWYVFHYCSALFASQRSAFFGVTGAAGLHSGVRFIALPLLRLTDLLTWYD